MTCLFKLLLISLTFSLFPPHFSLTLFFFSLSLSWIYRVDVGAHNTVYNKYLNYLYILNSFLISLSPYLSLSFFLPSYFFSSLFFIVSRRRWGPQYVYNKYLNPIYTFISYIHNIYLQLFLHPLRYTIQVAIKYLNHIYTYYLFTWFSPLPLSLLGF